MSSRRVQEDLPNKGVVGDFWRPARDHTTRSIARSQHSPGASQMPTSIQLLSLALPAAYAGVSGTLFSKDLISTPGFDHV